MLSVAKGNEIEVTASEVVSYSRITGQLVTALREVVQRKITAEAARKEGIKISTEELQKATDIFRHANNLHKARDTEEWLESKAISIEALEEYLETNLLISKFKDHLNEKASNSKYLEMPHEEEPSKGIIYRGWLIEQLK